MLLVLWPGNVLHATKACTFLTSAPPKPVRPWCVSQALTWKCASHHNASHFFHIRTSKTGLELQCFAHFDLEMCLAPQPLEPPATLARLLFDPLDPQISIGETQCVAAFLTLVSSFFWLSSILLFYSPLLSISSNLCFFIFPYCRKFDF